INRFPCAPVRDRIFEPARGRAGGQIMEIEMLRCPTLVAHICDHDCVQRSALYGRVAASRLETGPALAAWRFLVIVGAVSLTAATSIGPFATRLAAQPTAPVPYENMPEIAPPGLRIGKHIDEPESAKGPSVDPAKGDRP